MKYTASQIRYLIYLYRLSKNGVGVKNIELANALKLSKPSVHAMLKSLSEMGLVEQESFGLAHLTPKGRDIAHRYEGCFLYLSDKISEICGENVASDTAICSIMSDMPCEKIDLFKNLRDRLF